MTRFKVSGLLFAALLLTPFAAQAQAPTQAQQEAIRSQCRSDFMSNCSSVTPGGREALECLVRNKAHVSGGCQAALNAIAAPAAAAKPEAKPEVKPEPKAEAAAPVHAPAHAPATAAKPGAPKADTPKAAKAPAHPAAPKAATTKAATPAPDLAAAPPAAEAAPAAPPRPMRLGEALMVRRFCATDFKTLCKGVQIGQGRAVQCLVDNREALSPGCKQAMADTGR